LYFDFHVLVGEEAAHAAAAHLGGTDDLGRGPDPAPRRLDGLFNAGAFKP
jgi:hypothetical protein